MSEKAKPSSPHMNTLGTPAAPSLRDEFSSALPSDTQDDRVSERVCVIALPDVAGSSTASAAKKFRCCADLNTHLRAKPKDTHAVRRRRAPLASDASSKKPLDRNTRNTAVVSLSAASTSVVGTLTTSAGMRSPICANFAATSYNERRRTRHGLHQRPPPDHHHPL